MDSINIRLDGTNITYDDNNWISIISTQKKCEVLYNDPCVQIDTHAITPSSKEKVKKKKKIAVLILLKARLVHCNRSCNEIVIFKE